MRLKVFVLFVTVVPSENKRDQRTIEQVMADNRARKKQKTELSQSTETANQPADEDNK